MLAVIHRSTPPRYTGALSLAGPPLILRQLQWLRGLGCERVAIDVGADARGEELQRIVAEYVALARDVVFVHSPIPLSPRLLAKRAGLPTDVWFLALPESVIGNADLTYLYRRAPSRGTLVGRLIPPGSGGPYPPAAVRLVTPLSGPTVVERLPGWGISIDTPDVALRIACEALLGRLPRGEGGDSLLIHAAERAPGVWVARGGRIQRDVIVQPPVLVGAGALVCSGARIGPGAIIGARAIIESAAIIEHALVEGDTVVGEGLEVRDTIATPEGLAPLDGDGPVLRLGDPLLLAQRKRSLLQTTARLLKRSR